MNENLVFLTEINGLANSPNPTSAHMAYACLKWREKFQFDTVFLAVSGAPEEPITALAFDGKEELVDSGLYRLGVEERLALIKLPYKALTDITGKPQFNRFGSLKMQKPNGGVFYCDHQPENRFILFGLIQEESKSYPEALLKEIGGVWKDWLGALNQGLDKVLAMGYPSSPVKAYPVAPSNDPPAPTQVPKVAADPLPKENQSTAKPAGTSTSSGETELKSGEGGTHEEAGGKRRRPMMLVDEVTRLFNKAYFEESLAIEVERAKRYGRNVSLLFLEVTPLAPLGTQENQVANQVAEILSNSLRRVDVICRLDSTRYAIVLPDTANNTYGIIAKRIFKYFKQVMGDQPLVYINLSASTFPQHVENHLALYEHTENLLTQAKAAGPNKAVLPD